MFESLNHKRRSWGNRLIKGIAILSLVAAYIFGSLQSRNETVQSMEKNLPGKMVVKIKTNPDVYEVTDISTRQMDGWLILTERQGWGGPLLAGTLINRKKEIEKVIILNHRETPSFFEALIHQGYFEQYSSKPLQDSFQIGHDMDGVSGATVSSRAFADAVRDGAHEWGRSHFNLDIEERPVKVNVGANEFILIVLYAVILLSAMKKYRKMRYATMAFGIVFLGFYLSMPISVSAFGALALGYVPSFTGFTLWWLLISGAVLLSVLAGKNLYCAWACPFGGMQEFINMIGGVRVKVSPTIARMAPKIVHALFWVSFMIMFLTGNPAIGTFEPFSVLFSFRGLGVQWYLVSIAVVGSLMIPRFWCRFFCPVGLVLKNLAKTKKRITGWVKIKTGNHALEGRNPA